MVRVRLTAAVISIGLLGSWYMYGYASHSQRLSEKRPHPDQVLRERSFPPITENHQRSASEQDHLLDGNRVQTEYSVARTDAMPDQPTLPQRASGALSTASSGGAVTSLRRPVPHILHQSWKTAAIPAVWAPFIRSWVKLHSDWEYRFYSDDGLRRFFSRELPEFMGAFDSCDPICKADLSRLGFMLVFGGVYADMDFEALKTFDALVDAPAVHEAFLAKVRCPVHR